MRNLILNFISSQKRQKHSFIFSLATALILSSGCFFISIDFELEKLFPTSDPDLEFYQQIIKEKGYDNDFLLLSINTEDEFFNQEQLQNVDLLIDSLVNIHSITEVRSPVKMKFFDKSALGLTVFSAIHIEQPKLYQSDSLRIVKSDFHKRFFGDFNSIPVYIKHRHFDAQENSVPFLDSVRQVSDYYFDDYILTGKLPAENAFKSEIKADFGLYLGVSILISLFVLFAIYRKGSLSFIPFLVAVLTLVSTLGIMGLTGISINIMGVLLPPILLFTSTSDAIHIINAFDRSKKWSGIEKVLFPTFLTSFTTAVGFISLLWIDVAPVREFGISAAIGVLLAFVYSYTIIPFLLSKKSTLSRPTEKSPAFQRNILSLVRRFPGQIISIVLFVILLSTAGLSRLKIDAYLLADLPENHPVADSFEKMDDQYGGSKPWMAVIWPDSVSIWDSRFDQQIKQLHQYLQDTFQLSGLQSPEYFDEYMERVYKQQDHPAALQKAKQLSDNLNDTSYILTGFIPEWGSLKTRKKENQLRNFVDNNLNGLNLRITGTNYLIDKSHHALSKGLIKGLLTAIIIVSLLLGLFFRSIRWMFISLLPNLLTLLILGGLIGWLGIPLQLTNSIIFTVAFGIVVDDTIHFIVHYLEEKKNNNHLPLQATFNTAGKSIIFTSIIIGVGFSLFLLSDFSATFQLGLFLLIAIVTALLLDLLLLPAILSKWDEPKHQKRVTKS